MKMTSVQLDRAVLLMAGVIPDEPVRRETDLYYLRRVLDALHMNLRTAVHALVTMRRVVASLGEPYCMHVRPRVWELLFMAAVMLGDKMVEDRETSVSEWTRAFRVRDADLAVVERKILELLQWRMHVEEADMRRVVAEICAPDTPDPAPVSSEGPRN